MKGGAVFYLGTHKPGWLKRTGVPLFLSRRRLAEVKRLPKALGPWALDSGGFTELQKFGRWTVGPREYVDEVRRFVAGVGMPDFVAPQDWMCEPAVIHGGTFKGVRFAGTRLTVAEHQRRTVHNFLELRALAPEVPWMPVLQGYRPSEYLDCAALYERAGVDLGRLPRVGVGSVCRREATAEARDVFADLSFLKLRLHGFGLKKGFLRLAFGHRLESFDSMAWSRGARSEPPLEGCTHRSCANCLRYALKWREDLLALGERHCQPLLF